MRIPLPKGCFAVVHTFRIAAVAVAFGGMAWLGMTLTAEAAVEEQIEPVQVSIPFVVVDEDLPSLGCCSEPIELESLLEPAELEALLAE